MDRGEAYMVVEAYKAGKEGVGSEGNDSLEG